MLNCSDENEREREREREMGDKNMISSSSSTSICDNRNSSSCSDEISRFLRQILVRSSLPPAYPLESCGDPHADPRFFASPPSDVPLVKRGICAAVDEFSEGGASSAACFGPPPSAACFSGHNAQGNGAATATATAIHVSSSSVGASGNETDDYDCESEDGVGAVVDEPLAKPAPPRRSSKRSRAAAVHNLSEKRRRSRINEKMKALQNLIPNSNKTDKASMLDEAIEYLKQLQLQVQMLTMRNGLSLHPLCLPGGTLQPMQLTEIRPVSVEAPSESLLSQSSQFALVSNMPEIINTGTSYGLESSIRSHFGPFPVLNSPREMKGEDMLQPNRMSIGRSDTDMLGFEREQAPFEGQASEPEDRCT